MRHSSCRPICLIVFLPFLVLSGSAIASETGWIEVRSEHFSVITDAGEKNGRHVADRFEQMRSIFGLLFGRERINQPIPLQIIAFRNTKELRQYSPIFKGKIVELAGFFQQGEDKDFITVDMSQEESWRTVFHEYAHFLLNSNFTATAPWFDEGFAEFFSSVKVTPGEVEVGQSVPDADFLIQGNRLHLLELFEVQHHSETYNVTGERREMFYVQSWLVVHYLFDTNRIPQTAKYFRLTNEHKVPVAEAVQSAFGTPPAELEKTILNYLRGGKLLVLHYSGKDKIAITYNATVRPLNPLEARAQLADLHLHSPYYQALALREFEEVLKADPDQVGAQRGLGYAYLRNREFDKAGEHFREAARLGTKDARVYFYSAVLLQQSGREAMVSPELVQDVRHAIELDPEYADAYGLLGMCAMSAGEPAAAEQNLRRAMELAPRNEMFRFNYAMVLMNQQKEAEAKPILAGLANSSNPQVAQIAGDALRRIEDYETRKSRPLVLGDSAASPADSSRASPRMVEREEPTRSSAPSRDESTVAPLHEIDKRPMGWVIGKVLSVDCSSVPAATVSLLSGGKTYRLRTKDRDHLLLIHADKFSCEWKGVKVSVNYRDEGSLSGEMVTLELY